MPIIDPLEIIKQHCRPDSEAYRILIEHGRAVAGKAFEIAARLSPQPDLGFIEEASMLHDIGMIFTNQPGIGCYGDKPYICHGYLGRELLESAGLPLHALVCERHVGVGLTAAEIKEAMLPVPVRQMLPISIEEKVICFADKFFSKHREGLHVEKQIGIVRSQIVRYGAEQLARFDELCRLFGVSI